MKNRSEIERKDFYRNSIMRKLSAIFIIVLIATACDIENPGPIAENALNSEEAIPGIVVGMSSDLSVAVSTTTYWGSVWAGELTHSGTYSAPTIFSTGAINSEDVNPWWGDAQRSRWVAENGIERIQNILQDEYSSSIYAARANLYAGYSNRILGENVCEAVIDGGSRQEYTVHFDRAVEQFSEALSIAETLQDENIRNAAYAGRASAKAALGDWSGAASDAEQVPVEYRFDAIFSINSSRENNGWPALTTERGELTVWGTQFEGIEDLRVPQEVIETADGDTATAANGNTPWIAQMKHETDADNIALSKGAEMLLILAENELRTNSDVNAAMDYINQERAFYGLSDLSAANMEEAWTHLKDERGAVLWLEGRRFWDQRRWFEESGPAHSSFLEGRDKCVPIASEELNNNTNL